MRLAVVLLALALGAVLLTWLVVPEAESCRWGVQVWDGGSVEAGYVSAPCSLSEAVVRQQIDEHPPDLEVVDGADWGEVP